MRGFASAAVGVGSISQVLSPPICTAGEICSDIYTAGPLLFGPGVGLAFRFAKQIDGVAALESRMGMPASMLNFDMNVGVAARF